MNRTPIQPGKILSDELDDLNISGAQLARTLDVPPDRITKIIARKRAISADTAVSQRLISAYISVHLR